MKQATKASILTALIIVIVFLVVFGIYKLQKDLDAKPCEYFKNTDVRNLPVRCLNYFK